MNFLSLSSVYKLKCNLLEYRNPTGFSRYPYMHYSHWSPEWTSASTETMADDARVSQGINGKTSINLWSTCSAGPWNSKISLFNFQSAKTVGTIIVCIALISKDLTV